MPGLQRLDGSVGRPLGVQGVVYGPSSPYHIAVTWRATLGRSWAMLVPPLGDPVPADSTYRAISVKCSASR